MSNTPFRWGIIGPGNIARKFANGLKYSRGAVIGAVGSRTKERADEFAKDFNVPTVYGSYEELAADDTLDAVYVATPHSGHISGAKLCIEHGKPVLVEKPFTINAKEARIVIDLAREKNVFCMEGMWTRFFPSMVKARELVNSGAIGNVRMIQADFGFRAGIDPKGRLFDTALGGGALLDVGIYPVSFACMILGLPSKTAAVASIGSTKVDEVTGVLLQYDSGAIAVLSAAVRANSAQQAAVYGDTGSIHVNGHWWKSDGLTVKRDGLPEETLEFPYPATGFQFEADEVQRCVRAGLKESPIMPLSETLQIMELLDGIRSQIGLAYSVD
jgi:predicted dehydrogenase